MSADWIILSIFTTLVYFIFILYYSDKPYQKIATLSLSQTVPLCVFNLLITLPVALYGWTRFCPIKQDYPFDVLNVIKMIPTIFVGSFIFGVVHYIFHRITFLYNNIHKLHHRAIVTKPFDCLYVHPLEFVFTMIYPIMFAMTIFKLHIMLMYITVVFALHENVYAHFTHEDSTSEHNYHHKLFNVNYDSYPFIFGKFITKTYMKRTSKKDK